MLATSTTTNNIQYYKKIGFLRPIIDETKYQRKDWSSSEFGHVEGKRELPPNMPEPRGLGFTVRAKVDADHASDTVTRRSRTGFLVYINSALVYWFSKKQNSCETSSFGSEFTAMKQCCEYIKGLIYKLRMMGIPCEDPVLIEADNQSVLANTTIPDSVLKKKSQSIAYHMIREVLLEMNGERHTSTHMIMKLISSPNNCRQVKRERVCKKFIIFSEHKWTRHAVEPLYEVDVGAHL